MPRVVSIAAILSVFVLTQVPVEGGSRYKVIKVKKGATISGWISFSGELPELIIPVETDAKTCCEKGQTSKRSPRLVVDGDRGVRNAVVYLTKIRAGKAFQKGEYTLGQRSCTFVPHVVLMPQKERLKIKNGDPVLHNVHALLDGTDVFNIALAQKGQTIEKRMRRAGTIRLKCDAGHTWMSAYVIVAPHPYYALTDDKGNFSLEDIPPGKYTLRVWHEGWEKAKEIKIDVPVTLAEEQKIDLNFELKGDHTLAQKKSRDDNR